MFPPMTPPPFGWNGPDDDPRDGGRGPRGPRGRRGRGPRGPWDGPRPGRDFRDGLEQEIREYARRVKEEAREYQRLLEEEAREYEGSGPRVPAGHGRSWPRGRRRRT